MAQVLFQFSGRGTLHDKACGSPIAVKFLHRSSNFIACYEDFVSLYNVSTHGELECLARRAFANGTKANAVLFGKADEEDVLFVAAKSLEGMVILSYCICAEHFLDPFEFLVHRSARVTALGFAKRRRELVTCHEKPKKLLISVEKQRKAQLRKKRLLEEVRSAHVAELAFDKVYWSHVSPPSPPHTHATKGQTRPR